MDSLPKGAGGDKFQHAEEPTLTDPHSLQFEEFV